MNGFYVHGSSCIEKEVKIGEGTRIWHFCHVREGARIGRNCTIGQNVYIGRKVMIGSGVKLQNNVSVYVGVTLEDNVFCGPSVVFTNVLYPRAAYPKDPSTGYVSTLVKEGATLGANATILCGVSIGRHAFIGAGSVVTRDVPDYALVYGTPAKRKGWVCECGAKLDIELGRVVCGRCGKRYTKVRNGLKRA
jgi:UDP-2-acetamido-3-amino-2,3-dideoxy-glucuronate N-acetyltransferase